MLYHDYNGKEHMFCGTLTITDQDQYNNSCQDHNGMEHMFCGTLTTTD